LRKRRKEKMKKPTYCSNEKNPRREVCFAEKGEPIVSGGGEGEKKASACKKTSVS